MSEKISEIKSRMEQLKSELKTLAAGRKTELFNSLDTLAEIAAGVAGEAAVFGPGWTNECRLLTQNLLELRERLQVINTREDKTD